MDKNMQPTDYAKNLITKTLLLIATIILICPTGYCQKKTASRRPTKTATKSTKTTKTAKPPTKQPATVSVPARLFEGTLMYASQEYHSAAVQEYSFGQAYNGTHEQSITVSGNKAHVIDENILIHKIFDGDNNIVYIYSDLTNTGVSYPLSDYKKLYSQWSDNSTINKLTWGKSGKRNYKGDALNTYHATITSKMEGVDLKGSIELWSSPVFKVGDILKDVFYGLDSHGIIKKLAWESKSPTPTVGTLHSIASYELVAISEYTVTPDAFVVPDNVTIKPDNISTCKKTVEMYKKHRDIMKKKKISYNEEAENVLPKLANEWSFVQNIEDDERYTSDLGILEWGENKSSIITKAASLLINEIAERWLSVYEEKMNEMEEEESEREPYITSEPLAAGAPTAGAYNNNTVQGTVSPVTTLRTINDSNRRPIRGIKKTTQKKKRFDLSRNSEQYRQYMSKAYVTPGTKYDPRIHYKCIDCNGKKGRCPTCNGMGFYKKKQNLYSDVPKKKKIVDCTHCKGNGVCSSCKGTGKGFSDISLTDIKRSCESCHGQKKCWYCKGKGTETYYVSDRNGTRKDEDHSTQSVRKEKDHEVQCNQCYGSGKCRSCQGTGFFGKYEDIIDRVKCNICSDNPGKCHVCHGKKTVTVTSRDL